MQSKRVGDILKNCNDNPDAVRYKYFTIIPGKSNVIISAPHAYEHIRNGKRKPKDKRTLTIAKMISELTNAHVIYTNKDIPYDPNFTPDNKYQKELVSYIQNNNIKYLIDIHGTRLVRDAHLEIGTNELDNFNHDETLLDNLVSIFEKNKIEKIRIDKRFKGSNNTICNIINNKTGIQTIQLEISKKYRSIKNGFQDFKTIINALLDVIYYLERREIMENINFVEKYDETLDIKPAYGYNRVLNKIGYDRVGLEIEVSVSFERNSYSFIRKMLKKIKELVGDNGYFVKDNTVLGDYNFEIVLDPLTIPEIKELYASLLEIIRFSNGAIEISKEKNCGIHMNFNRADITDLNESHKRLTAFVSEHPSYFDENIYKHFKFIWYFTKFQQY